MSLRFLERVNQDDESLFYRKINFDKVGIVGHSQGGVGVINATDHHQIYRTAVAISPTNQVLAHQLYWDYDVSKITIPILFLSGAGVAMIGLSLVKSWRLSFNRLRVQN